MTVLAPCHKPFIRNLSCTKPLPGTKMATIIGRLRIRGASQVVQVCSNGERSLRGSAMRNLAIINAEETNTVGIVVDETGKIAGVG